MPETVDERFDIAFAGECLEGFAPAEVRAALARLFKADEATLERLFSGKRQRVKRACDKATALRYQQAMSSVGARAIVTRNSDNTDTAHAGLSLLPPGSDILAPAERKTVEVSELNLAHLSIAAHGERLSEAQPEPNVQIEAPALVIAEVGSTLSPAPPAATTSAIAPPDTSGMQLVPEGHDLSDCSPPPATTPELNLDQLELAPSGSDLLQEDERQHSDAQAPDTSHLQLEDPAQR